jgi:tetratricopeptide (TPR) repeat protein
VQGQILAAQNLWDDAARAFEAAIAILEESNSRLELGRALYRRGMMWQARGDVEAARSDGGRARALFAECGATRDLGRVAQALG